MIAAQPDSDAVDGAGLDVTLDRPLPGALLVGPATAVFCAGSCVHRDAPVEDLAIVVDGVRHRPTAQGLPRSDRRSGFWATVPIEPRERPVEIEMRAEATLTNGTTASAVLDTIGVVEPPAPPSFDRAPRTGRPLIAICMTTFNSKIELFRTQVESIRAQTDSDWVCLISDDCSEPERFEAITETVAGDPRFAVSRAQGHLGFYRNFERALAMAPPQAELVALCDHDDRWYPDKLQVLRTALGDAELAYSDSRLVDATGKVRRETLWRGRRGNHSNLASLLISNTIPGAACLFRRRVIERALPFPGDPGWGFHDHWLGLVALALGEVVYVDRPLYDYVQHPGAVLGHVASDPEPALHADRLGLRARIERGRGFLGRWRSAYFTAYLHGDLQARVLLARCAAELSPRKRRALRLLIAASRSPLAFAWLAVRPARALLGANETLGAEGIMVRGILWRRLAGLRAIRRKRAGGSSDDFSVPSFDPHGLGPRLRRWLAHG